MTTIDINQIHRNALDAIADALADSGRGDAAHEVRRAIVSRVPCPSEDVALALALTDRLVRQWTPDALALCGLDEGVWGELTTLSRDVVSEASCEVIGDVFTEVYEINALEGDYSAFRAIEDAKWIANCAQRAAASAGCAQDHLLSGEHAEAMDAARDAVVSVVRAVSTRTCPQVDALLRSIAWLREVA